MLAICNGMARGGSTLLYNVARTLVECAAAGSGHGFVTSAETHGCYCSPEQLAVWAASDAWHVVKTHEVLRGCADYIKGDRTRVLYIYWDLRDVAVSMKRAFYIDGEKLLSTMGKAVRFYGMLSELRDANPEAVLWQRYEDVYVDLPAAINVCADFLALDASEEQLEAVYRVCWIEASEALTAHARRALARALQEARKESPAAASALREQVRENGWLVPQFILRHHHISPQRGAPGAWQDLLTSHEVEAISSRFGPWLEARGYTSEDI